MERKKLNLENTEIAFARLSNTALKNAYWLFKAMKFERLGKVGAKVLLGGMKMGLPVEPLIKYTMFKHFCGGETIDACQSLIADMNKYNVGAVLDYSVEGAETESDFNAATDEIIKTIKFAAQVAEPKFAVFKATGIARFGLLEKIQDGRVLNEEEVKSLEQVKFRVDKICSIAVEHDVRLMIDAEDFQIQDTIDNLVFDMMKKYNKEQVFIYNTLQMYRWDRLDYLKSTHEIAQQEGFKIGVKIVRGAYLEQERERAREKGYPSPVFNSKAETDKAYNDCLTYCLEHLDNINIFAGTHNEVSTVHLTSLMEKYGVNPSDPRVVFSQLHGMSDNLSYNLGSAQYNVRKYLPFGPIKKVFPYLVRRAEENSSIQGQATRELNYLEKEMKRRRMN